jgi:hypothetical protein
VCVCVYVLAQCSVVRNICQRIRGSVPGWDNLIHSVLGSWDSKVGRLANDWTVRRSNLCGGEIVWAHPDQTEAHLASWQMVTACLFRGKAAGAWRLPPTHFWRRVRIWLELCFYFTLLCACLVCNGIALPFYHNLQTNTGTHTTFC